MLFGFRIPWPLPIGLPAGITLAAPASFSRLRQYRIVGRVNEHREPVLHELFGRLERVDGVGQERSLVGEAFELHPVRAGVLQVGEQFASEPGVANRVVGAEATGRVRQRW